MEYQSKMIKQDVGLSWAITMSKNSANWEQGSHCI